MKVRNWLVLGVLAALAALVFVPATAGAAGVSSLYLSKHKSREILTTSVPTSKGGHHEDAQINPKKPSAAVYKELGTWDTGPATSASRIINLGQASLWLRTDADTEGDNGDKDKKDSDKEKKDKPNPVIPNVQVKVEVLKNGVVISNVTRESGCVTLQQRNDHVVIPPTLIALPAPFPAIDLAVGDSLALRVSVRDGSAVPGCAIGTKSYKVLLDYDGASTPSNFTIDTSGSTVPAGGLINIGQPSFIDYLGVHYVTPATPITLTFASGIATCTMTLTSLPDGTVLGQVPCATGPGGFTLQGLPSGRYEIRIDAVTSAVPPQTLSDVLEVTLVQDASLFPPI